MSLLEKWKQHRRRARVARLRREISDLTSLLQKLHPDYDHSRIYTTAAKIIQKRQELARLTNNRKDA